METFATEHLQINAVLRGDFLDVDRTKNPSGVYLVYDVVSINPAGDSGITFGVDVLICDNVTEINNSTNSATDRPMRTVSEFTIRLDPPLSVSRKYNPDPRLITMAMSIATIRYLIIMVDRQSVMDAL